MTLSVILEQFKKWDTINITERKNLLYELKKYGYVSKLEQKQPVKVQLKCPLHKNKILCDCKLTKCKFYVDYSWSKNCLLYYMEEHGKHKLQAEEISFLYKIPVTEVKAAIKKAFALIRREVLEDYIEDKVRQGFIKHIYFPKDCCITCGKKLSEELNVNYRLSDGYGWCSEICKAKKPKEIFEIEEYYGIPYSTYITYSQNLFREKIKDL